MADKAHVITDKVIKQTEKRLQEEYSKAAKELEEKFKDYFRRYEAKDKKWREWVAQGKKTEKEYKAWKKGQLIVGKRWREMKETATEDMRNVNRIARQICEGQRVDIYAINHAYGTYQIERYGVNTSYTLYNHEAVEEIIRNNPQLMPPPGKKVSRRIAEGKAKRWSKQKIQSVAIQAILQGDSIPDMAKRLAKEVADSDFKAAVRNARTMATGAQNAGRYEAYRRAAGMGIDLIIEWAAVLDNRTRHAHRQMHGQRTTVDKPFRTPDGYTIMYPADCTGTSDAPQKEIWCCRCTLLAWVKGFEHDTLTDSDKMTMSFDDWVKVKPGHEKFEPILKQYETGRAIKMQYVREYKNG